MRPTIGQYSTAISVPRVFIGERTHNTTGRTIEFDDAAIIRSVIALLESEIMNRLWTPWRMSYVTGQDQSPEPTDSRGIFVAALESAGTPDSLVVHRGSDAFAIMNLFPYNTGHMMVVPNRKVAVLEELSSPERHDLIELVSEATSIVETVLRCDGVNVGFNIGTDAGAGVSDHLHVHIVPRWRGDANFMPTIAQTAIFPELLQATTARIKAEFATRSVAASTPGIRRTAGALVYLPGEKRFVFRKANDGSFVLPKGHIEPEESAADAAIREVHEETGYRSTIVNWLGINEFTLDGEEFHTPYFLAHGARTDAVDGHLGIDTVLVKPDAAIDTVSIPGLRPLIQRGLDLLTTKDPPGSEDV